MRVAICRILGGLALVGMAGWAAAAPVAFDGFESYSAGAPLAGGNAGTGGTGANGEFGWTGDWAAVTGVTTQTAVLSGGGSRAAEITDNTNSVTAATRTFTPQTGTVYFSVLVDPVAGLEGSDFLHFYLSNNALSNNNSGGVGLLQTTSDLFGARVGGSNGGTTVNSNLSAVQGTTYLLVGKLSKTSGGNYNRIDLFINPASATEPGSTYATQNGDSGIDTVSVFAVRSFNFDVGDRYQFDNVTVGTSFADVVPEPGGLGLLALGALGLLARRR